MINDLKETFDKITYALAIKEKGKFPAQPQSNPKSHQNPHEGSSGSQHLYQVKSIITLRSGKTIHKPILEPHETEEKSESEGKE